MSESVIKVALVEDRREEREALTVLLRGYAGFQCVGSFDHAEAALEALPALAPDVVLMDIHLPGLSGIEAAARLRAVLPSARVMMLTVFEDSDHIFQALRAGAHGYLLKKTRAADLLEAVRELKNGGAPMSAAIARQVVEAFHAPAAGDEMTCLSPRERQIVDLLAQGLHYKEISTQLDIGISTVRTHIGRIYEKLHVHSRAEVMLKVLPARPASPRV